ncbi:RING/U-box superfamily protein [Tasmannia lanceolata]|uniref:RING/U-box superfamily protein n=1 Tax=Tasmannia lanceolata TaxID=3420 RepID=UPI00406359D4
MEPGECSGTKVDEETWARLVPSDSRYSDVEIKSNEMIICSEITRSSPEKHKWCKITRNEDLISATIQNLSSSTILVDETVIGKEESTAIKCGSEVISGSKEEGCLRYNFEVMPIPKLSKNQIKITLDVEHTKCSICLNIWHDVVTVAPCLHNFCNGCFSEWLRRSQEKGQSVLCPQCRASIQSVARNHFLHNIEEVILQTDSSLKRSDDELTLLDTYASIQSNLIIGSGNSRKRPFSPSSDESYGADLSCPQCGFELAGFRCNQTTTHLQCQSCGELMPLRTDIGVPQHCLGCDKTCCGAYWRAQGGVASDFHMVCSPETFKPISEHTIDMIPDSTHQNNRYEKAITENLIRQTGKTLRDVISNWIGKLNNREIDRSRMPLNHAEMITATTYLCRDCYGKLVAYLLYWFRISTPGYFLPPDAAKREDCWYGYACRTQHHSDEHAQKRNHVCRPTKGNHGI